MSNAEKLPFPQFCSDRDELPHELVKIYEE
jgi:hypothetical protein